MRKIALFIAILLVTAGFQVMADGLIHPFAPAPATSPPLAMQPGTPVFIQIFKQERTLDLYGLEGNQYRLINSFRICDFSGGLGPKRVEGDFKSPEGFYTVRSSQLNPDSHFNKAINIGFPNQFDRENGYNGKYLMIHGNCVSIGCYAMTDTSIDQIYAWVSAALRAGQSEVDVDIFPFRMTDQNMQLHRYSDYYNFWQQLKPGYDYFQQHHQPPAMSVQNGRYVLSQDLPRSAPLNRDPFSGNQSPSKPVFTLAQTK